MLWIIQGQNQVCSTVCVIYEYFSTLHVQKWLCSIFWDTWQKVEALDSCGDEVSRTSSPWNKNIWMKYWLGLSVSGLSGSSLMRGRFVNCGLILKHLANESFLAYRNSSPPPSLAAPLTFPWSWFPATLCTYRLVGSLIGIIGSPCFPPQVDLWRCY